MSFLLLLCLLFNKIGSGGGESKGRGWSRDVPKKCMQYEYMNNKKKYPQFDSVNEKNSGNTADYTLKIKSEKEYQQS
jgi:hypothetical protein